MVIVAQSTATARVYALRHQQRLDENADLVGLSAANMAAALSGTFVVNGSPTQTAMVESSGGRSQLAQVSTAVVVALVLLFLTRPLQYLPRCVLGAVVFLIAVKLIDVRGLRRISSESPGEFILAVTTASVVVLAGVEAGIVLAMVLSLLRVVRHSYQPHTAVLVPGEDGIWQLIPAVPGRDHRAWAGDLPLWGSSVLCKRQPVFRRSSRPGGASTFASALAGRRCRGDYERRLHRRMCRAGT